MIPHTGPLVGLLVLGVGLAAGVWFTSATSVVVEALVAGRRPRLAGAAIAPFAEAAFRLHQERRPTEAPDATSWMLAPACYLGLAIIGASVVPFTAGLAVADFRVGIVVWGAAESLAIVAVFLHGWAPNSLFALIGAYRFVAVALSYTLLSMFVLIAAALPAESLAIGAIVASQESLWNVVRQPLGLPLFLVVGLGVTFTGPLNVVDADDLAGGSDAEASGAQHLVWRAARAAMVTAVAAVGAAVFLGGWHGPLLPGWLWSTVKTLVLIVVLVAGGHLLARVPTERFVRVTWTVLLPLSFLGLGIAGVAALP